MENIEDIKAELKAAKEEADAFRQAAQAAETAKAKLEASIAAGSAAAVVKGTYKGHKFADGHNKVRDINGAICDAEKLLAAAAAKDDPGHQDAVAVLDWLIEIKYAYFVKK